MTKVKSNDPLAAAQNAVNDAIAAAQENHQKFVKTVEAEAGKAQKVAQKGFDQAVSAHHANIDALVAATMAAVDGFGKVGSLAKDQIAQLEGQAGDVKSVLGVKDPKEAVDLQIEMATAGHKQFTAFAEAFAQTTQEIANDVLKPVQAQAAANLKVLSQLKVA